MAAEETLNAFFDELLTRCAPAARAPAPPPRAQPLPPPPLLPSSPRTHVPACAARTHSLGVGDLPFVVLPLTGCTAARWGCARCSSTTRRVSS
jgi:hypothetical protein